MLALVGAHHILHVSRIGVKSRRRLLEATDYAKLVEEDEITNDVAQLILGMLMPDVYLNSLDIKEKVGGKGLIKII